MSQNPILKFLTKRYPLWYLLLIIALAGFVCGVIDGLLT